MALASTVLTDRESHTWLDSFQLAASDVGAPSPFSVHKLSLRDGLSEGVDMIEIDNGRFFFAVLPTRGMGIWYATLRQEDKSLVRIGWKSPVKGPVHPQFVPLGEPSGLGWLNGFDELLVRCGLVSNGAPDFDDKGQLLYPLHGHIANRPAHRVEVGYDDATEELVVTGVVDETRFHFAKLRLTTTIRTKLGESGFRIHDEITNLSALPSGIQLLYHVNFGPPLLDAGARVVAPIKSVVPRDARAVEGIGQWNHFAAEEPGYSEQVYFAELIGGRDGKTQAMLRNAHGTLGASLHYAVKELPCFTLWKDTAAEPDGYVTGLEPGLNFPNPRTYEESQGRVLMLKPGETRSFDVRLEIHGTPKDVEAATTAITAFQGGVRPRVFDKPQKGWSSAG